MTKLHSRLLIGGALATGLAFTLPAHAQQTELIVSGFGGAYDEAMAASVKSFEEANNVKVTIVPAAGADNLARVRNKEIDIMVSDPIFALRLEAEDSFVKLDPAIVTNLQYLYPQAVYSDYTVSANFGAYVIAYNPDKITTPPESWYDLAKPEYEGKVALRGFRPENIELIVLFAKLAGGDEKNPDAGFAEMAKIARNVHVWVTSHAEMLDLYRSGQVDLGTWTDARIAWAKNDEKVNVAGSVPKEGFFPLSSTISVVKGRPNAELALKLVNPLLSIESGINMATRLGYFPTNSQVELPADIQAKLVLNKDNIKELKTADWKYLVTVYDEWQSRWEKEVVK